MGRVHVEYLRLEEIAAQPRLEADGTSGFRCRPLSRDPDRGDESFIAEIPPFWFRRRAGYYASRYELLVLAGELRIGDQAYPAGSYLDVPAGLALPDMSSPRGCRLFWASHGPLDFWRAEPADTWPGELRAVQCAGARWEAPPAYEGRSLEDTVPGMTHLALNPAEAGGPYTYLVRMAPGWSDPRLESHETWEELLLLQGDFLMANFGELTGGSYIFRPGFVPHGPQATRSGAVWIARGEKRINFNLSPLSWGEPVIAEYLAAPPSAAGPGLVDWL